MLIDLSVLRTSVRRLATGVIVAQLIDALRVDRGLAKTTHVYIDGADILQPKVFQDVFTSPVEVRLGATVSVRDPALLPPESATAFWSAMTHVRLSSAKPSGPSLADEDPYRIGPAALGSRQALLSTSPHITQLLVELDRRGANQLPLDRNGTPRSDGAITASTSAESASELISRLFPGVTQVG